MCGPGCRVAPPGSWTCDAAGMSSVYEAVGSDALRRLAQAWHERVLADDVVAHAFHGDIRPDHTERLAAYWAEALGGPTDYTDRYGSESDVVRMHSGNGPHEEMDRRAVDCFDRALDDAGINDARARRALHDYFAWATTTTMAAYEHSAADVPPDLRLPHWSWDGLQA